MNDVNNDWTDKFSRKDLSENSNSLVNNIISSLYSKKIKLLESFSLSENEIGMLYRWSLYVSSNTFIERLCRVINNEKIKKENTKSEFVNHTYYTSLSNFAVNYYNNDKLNQKLISDISNIIFRKTDKKENYLLLKPKKIIKNIFKKLFSKNYSLTNLSNFLSRKLENISLKKDTDIDFLFEDSQWLNLIFEKKNKIKEFNYNIYEIDNVTRSEFRKCFYLEFNKFLNTFFFKSILLDNKTKDILSHLFSFWVDCSFAQSIVEGLKDRINFYDKYIKKYDLKYVHTCLGFFNNDNVKVLLILAKRKKIKVVGHEHGVNNFVNHFWFNSSNQFDYNINNYKNINQLLYTDIFCAWGKNKLPDNWDGVEKKTKTKIYNLGSVYLSKLKKIKNKKINVNNLVVLFVDSPFRKYIANLEEITFEKNAKHKENVFLFIKKILDTYKHAKVIYKNFKANYKTEKSGQAVQYDLINNYFADEIKQNRIIISNHKPTKLIYEADVVLFDMISTGFAEAINIEIPALVYGHKYYYSQSSKNGREINDELEDVGILFYDKKTGIKSFNNIINDSSKFAQSTKEVIEKYKLMNSYPISKKNFLEKIDKIL